MIPILNKGTNHFDIYLFLLIALLGFGGIGGSLQLVRVGAVIMAPVYIQSYLNHKEKSTMPFLLFFLVWYAYSVASLFWTPDLTQAGKELVYYPLHMFLFLEIVAFAKLSNRPLSSITAGWVVTFLGTAGVAMLEISSGHHLSMSLQADDYTMNNGLGELLVRKFASVTFGNYNTYCTFIGFAFPFIAYAVFVSKKLSLWGILATVSMFLGIYFVLINGSRGTLITLFIITMVFFYFSFKTGEKSKRHFVYFFILVALYAVRKYAYVLFETIGYRLATQEMTDTTSREDIWVDALTVCVDMLGLGTGVGSILAVMSSVRIKGEVMLTHNLFLEILVQYGIVIFLGFIYYLFVLLRQTFQQKEKAQKMVLVGALASLPFLAVVNSGYLLEAMTWAYFASLFAFAFLSDNNKENEGGYPHESLASHHSPRSHVQRNYQGLLHTI